jgi:LPXTG-motif cell wall-anchored protein
MKKKPVNLGNILMYNIKLIQMKKTNFMATLFFIVAMFWAGNLVAQDSVTYIDNVSTQDSSNMGNADLNLDQKAGKESSNTALFIGIGVILVGAAAIILLRKKKK